MSYAIGIDPSINSLAVCILGSAGCYANKVFKAPALESKTLNGRIERYVTHATEVCQYVESFAPATICIEGYSHGSRGSSTLTLAEFGIVLRNRLMWDAHTIVEVPPNTLKKFVTGKGNASKAAVTSALAKRYELEFDTDDEADAYGLARLCGCIIGMIEPSVKHERTVSDEVRKLLELERGGNGWRT